MAFIFGYIIVGNIVDNVATPKNLAIILQLGLGFCWIFTGIQLIMILDDGECDDLVQSTKLGVCSQVCASGIVLINIL